MVTEATYIRKWYVSFQNLNFENWLPFHLYFGGVHIIHSCMYVYFVINNICLYMHHVPSCLCSPDCGVCGLSPFFWPFGFLLLPLFEPNSNSWVLIESWTKFTQDLPLWHWVIPEKNERSYPIRLHCCAKEITCGASRIPA